MSEKLAFEIYYIELWHIFSVVFIITINFYIYLNGRKNSLLYSYLTVEALLLIWMVSKIFKTVSPNSDLRWFFIVTQYFGNCFLGPAFFAFAYTYAKKMFPQKRVIVLTVIPAIIFFMAMASNPLHMLFYSYYDYYRDSFGPIFYIHQAYTYSLMIMGIILCVKRFNHDFQDKRIHAVIISLAVMIPLLANIFYILKLFEPLFGFRPLFDITPITCNISLTLFAIGTFRYRFFDITGIAWRKVFNQIPEGVVLLNNDKVITDMNHYSSSSLETEEILNAFREYYSPDKTSEYLHTSSTGRIFRVYRNPYFHKNKSKGYVLKFVDETNYRKGLQSLSDKNETLQNMNKILSSKAKTKQDLIVYKTRNFIGSEIHDILGHSIVLALSILEVARLSLKEDSAEARLKFEQALVIIKNAKEQMTNTISSSDNENKKVKNSLMTEIKKLVNEAHNAGHNISLTIQGSDSTIPEHVSEGVLRLCQEAVTNSIRHGKAEKITIILRLYNSLLEVYILDNGSACSEIKKGYGLKGMEQRIVKRLGGVLDYGSIEGGFTVRASVPLCSAK